jgi:colicin import membrane protein
MQMRTASAISAGLHAAVLLWATFSFTGRSFPVTPTEALPVDMISDKQFSEMTKGVKEAPKPVEKPKPLVEKKEAPKPVEDIKPKVTEKQEIKAAAEKPPEAPPPPKEQKQAEKPPEQKQKPDPIGDKIAQAEKKEANAKPTPLPPKRPPMPQHAKQPDFNPNQIAALLDQRTPQRHAATGEELNGAPTMGTALGNASKLSQSELDALRAKLMALWNPPVGMQDANRMQITIRIRFKPDGTLAAGPQVVTAGSGVQYNALRDSAVRAVFVGQPYTMLRPDHYEIWKEIDFTFDTSEMFHDIPVTSR